jgi:isopentenyl diphosphate isomerase/L-lactate dehydrogenase-like FMN-dependent dehydrogenase
VQQGHAVAFVSHRLLVGRAYAWALGAAGGPGVSRAIAMLRADLVRTMRLLGCRSIDELDASCVEMPQDWARATHMEN